jgi:hypothetical protein
VGPRESVNESIEALYPARSRGCRTLPLRNLGRGLPTNVSMVAAERIQVRCLTGHKRCRLQDVCGQSTECALLVERLARSSLPTGPENRVEAILRSADSADPLPTGSQLSPTSPPESVREHGLTRDQGLPA